MIAAAIGAALLPRAFLPPFNEGTFTINMLFNPGISLAESNRVGLIAEKLMLEVPEVKAVGRRTGRAELDEHAEGVHSSEIEVDLKEGGPQQGRGHRRSCARGFPCCRSRSMSVSPSPTGSITCSRACGRRSSSSSSARISTRCAHLPRPSAARLAKIDGLADLQVEKQVRIPQLEIMVDYTRAALYGLQPQAITEQLETALQRPRRLEAGRWHAALRCRAAPQ